MLLLLLLLFADFNAVDVAVTVAVSIARH